MDDLAYGKRNKRGDWTPSAYLTIAPVFVLPPKPLAFLKWLPGYFLPWNLLFAASAVAYALFVLPDVEVMKTLAWGWILRLFIVNCLAVFLFYSAFEYWLYMTRAQGNRFKYHAKFPNDQKNSAFLFRSQNLEGIIRGFGTGVPIWTAYEVGILFVFAFANGYAPWLSFAQHPLYLGCVALLVPIFQEFHFFCIHRLIHWPPLYRSVHSVHHHSVNPSPWSSLSMHPVEQLLYFSSSLIHSFESGARALSTALRGVRRGRRPHRLRQDRDRQGDRLRQPRLRPLPPPQIFRGELRRRPCPFGQAVRHVARRLV
jgi:Fatty acid hydroxylase superfamily